MPDSDALSALDGPGARLVLAAAVDAMAEHGYHGTSVRDIGERAGMSSAALYHHFPSKQTLLFTIMDRGMDDLIRRSEEAYAAAPEDPAEKLRALVTIHVLRHIEHQKGSFLGNSELRSLEEPGRGTILAKRDHQMHLFYRAVRDGVTQGRFHAQFPSEAARSIITMCTGMATWYRASGPLSPEEIAHRYAELALDMVGCEPRLRIVVDDLSGAEIAAFIGEHMAQMQVVTPEAESRHALDLSGLREPGVTFWSVLSGSDVVGCGALKRLSASHAELKSMRTALDRKRSGIASLLLSHIIAEARQMGFRQLSLETGAGEFFVPARRLYEKFGFTYCSPFPPYREDPSSLFMTRTI